MSDQNTASSPFEAIRQTTEDDTEYWSARDLAEVLGYAKWANFVPTIKGAQTACEGSGYAVSDHFLEVRKMVSLGSGAQRGVQDFHLSRYACYLVVQNADPGKPIVALGQTYFAVRTRENDYNDGSDEQGILPFDDGSAGRVIRKEWHEGRWFFSVIDVIAVLTDSPEPRTYWAVLKKRLADEGAGQLLTNCKQLKMRALDGRMRATDAADLETMLRIIQSVPSPKAEPVRQWLAQVGAQRLDEAAAELDENQRRLLLRGEVAAQNTGLNAAASSHGLVTSRDFAIFHDWGYRGLYNGETARDIAARKGVTKGRILDYMESTELAANWFRITQTGDKLRHLADEGVTGQGIANQTHYHMGKAVRAFIVEQGNTLPEDSPTPAQSIQQVERAEQERARARLQPSLFLSVGQDGENGSGDPQ